MDSKTVNLQLSINEVPGKLKAQTSKKDPIQAMAEDVSWKGVFAWGEEPNERLPADVRKSSSVSIERRTGIVREIRQADPGRLIEFASWKFV